MPIKGTPNTEDFHADVREILISTLRVGDIVILDQLGARRNELSLALIAQAGTAVRFLPALRPNLHPIKIMGIPK